MTTLAIPTYFHSWEQETSGDGAILVNDNGQANISASAGSNAYLYTSVQLFPGDTIEFSCNTYAASGQGQVQISAFTTGSGIGNTSNFNASLGGNNNGATTVHYTAPFQSDECIIVYLRVGVETSVSGSTTVMCPRANIKRGFIGTTRTNAAALLELNGGTVNINTSYVNTGIQEVNLVDDGSGVWDVEIVMDKIIAMDSGAPVGLYPHLQVSKWHSTSTTTSQLEVGVKSYNSLTRRVLLRFVNLSTGAPVDARSIFACNIMFKSELI